jgi:hypothetical protein
MMTTSRLFPSLLAATALLAGCASVSEVVPTGAGTFLVAAHGVDGNGSGAAQKAIALRAASDYCNKSAQRIEVIRADTVEPMFGRPPSAEVNFRCAAN